IDVLDRRLSFTMESPVFALDNEKVLPPSFAFPFRISLNAGNARTVFEYQDRPDSKVSNREFEDVQMYVAGTPFFVGKLIMIRMNRDYADVSFTINNLKKLAEVKLTE